KGSWVLQMLRSQLGEELYRRCIKTYLERYKFQNVVTENLSSVIEEVSGRSFDQFFDQWVYHAHYPELEAAYSWDAETKLAKISIKQIQKISEDVFLFNFPMTVRFNGKSGKVDKEFQVKEREEDFYFPLAEAPESVCLDPKMALLAKIKFTLPNAMLYALLADQETLPGRLFAIEQLAEKKDGETLKQLARTLENDPFYGMHIEAAKALQKIHSDEALSALLAAQQKSSGAGVPPASIDARVRNQLAASIGAFYSTNAFSRAEQNILSEKNPEIRAQWIRDLGNFPKAEAQTVLLPLLETDSYRNILTDATIAAMRAQDDPVFIDPIRKTLEQRETNFTSRGFAAALDTLGYLTRHETKRDSTREFLLSHVNDKKQTVQLGAIAALGTLEDPKATAVLENFANMARENPERKAAEKSLAAIRAAGRPTDNLKALSEEILGLKNESRETKKELDALKKKLEDAPKKPEIKPASPSRRKK
ncbi:MAG: HEAT repeat domain-containing protein, partial [Verrucomicrobiota bacterium]